ncbi:unnamed protein product [Trichobilharzia szidati]|nr:unnamed protein product [Trichobilharzia szidati]
MSIYDGSNTIERIKEILSKGKTLFSFESCQERLLYPEAIPHHRLGITLTPISNHGLAGPATYDPQFTGINDFSKKPMSLRGYTLGARTAPRLTSQLHTTNAPDPGAYQNHINNTLAVKPNKKPFNRCAPRCNISPNVTSTVGVGTYDITSEIGRRVQWQRDTMLHPVNLPTIEQKSTIPVNTDKLSTTAECKRYQRKLAYLQLYFK